MICSMLSVACRYIIKGEDVDGVTSSMNLLIGVNVTPPYRLYLTANVVFGQFCIVSARHYQVSELR